jgi:dihydrofolate reductase
MGQEVATGMRLSLIVAVSENRVIGCDGRLPWRLSADLRRFKKLTMGHHLVMGRKTFESIGRALPGRTSLVLSRQTDYRAPGATVVPDLRRVMQLAAADTEVFVIGGGEIYRQVLPTADRIYMTQVHARVDGEVTFPELPEAEWRLRDRSPRQAADDSNDHDYTFLEYERVNDA